MRRTVLAAALAAAFSVGSALVAAEPASAVTDYANCDALHKDFKYGVATSKAAAAAQVKKGMYKPAVAPSVYAANDESDADHDGTACEVLK